MEGYASFKPSCTEKIPDHIKVRSVNAGDSKSIFKKLNNSYEACAL